MAITYVTNYTYQNTSGQSQSSVSVTTDSKVAAGDLLLAVVALNFPSGGSPSAFSAPANWTQLSGSPWSTTALLAGAYWYVLWKIATSSDANSTITFSWSTSSTVYPSLLLLVYSGTTSSPIDAASATTAQDWPLGVSSITAPSVSASKSNDLLVCIFSVVDPQSQSRLSLPSALTQRVNLSVASGNYGPGFAAGDLQLSASGSTPTEQATGSNYSASDQLLAVSIALLTATVTAYNLSASLAGSAFQTVGEFAKTSSSLSETASASLSSVPTMRSPLAIAAAISGAATMRGSGTFVGAAAAGVFDAPLAAASVYSAPGAVSSVTSQSALGGTTAYGPGCTAGEASLGTAQLVQGCGQSGTSLALSPASTTINSALAASSATAALLCATQDDSLATAVADLLSFAQASESAAVMALGWSLFGTLAATTSAKEAIVQIASLAGFLLEQADNSTAATTQAQWALLEESELLESLVSALDGSFSSDKSVQAGELVSLASSFTSSAAQASAQDMITALGMNLSELSSSELALALIASAAFFAECGLTGSAISVTLVQAAMTLAASWGVEKQVAAIAAAAFSLLSSISSTISSDVPLVAGVVVTTDLSGTLSASLASAFVADDSMDGAGRVVGSATVALYPGISADELVALSVVAALAIVGAVSFEQVAALLTLLQQSASISVKALEVIRVTVALILNSPLAQAVIIGAQLYAAVILNSVPIAASIALESPFAQTVSLASELSSSCVISGA